MKKSEILIKAEFMLNHLNENLVVHVGWKNLCKRPIMFTINGN